MAERINEFETINNQKHKVNEIDNNMYNNTIKSPGLEISNNDNSLFPTTINAIPSRIENKEKKSNKLNCKE